MQRTWLITLLLACSATTPIAAQPAGDPGPPPPDAGVIPVGPPADPRSDELAGPAGAASATGTGDQAQRAEDARVELDPVQMLLDEIDRLNEELLQLRRDLAEARLEAASAGRELADLRRFMEDHDELGSDFQQYRNVLESAASESRQQQLEQVRQQYEQQRAERLARMQEARTERARERAERDRITSYQRRGFSPLGLDVFISQMAFSYHSTSSPVARFDYRLGFGNYLRFSPNASVDFSRMTISGSVLNASERTRNIGVAIAFFDELGNQVGHEIVQVKNAHPDVPYPFTSTIDMALDRPFASSSQYVLYADPS